MQSFAFTKKKAPQVKVAVQHEEAKEDVDYLTAVNDNALEGTKKEKVTEVKVCLLYTSPSPRDATLSRMPSSA